MTEVAAPVTVRRSGGNTASIDPAELSSLKLKERAHPWHWVAGLVTLGVLFALVWAFAHSMIVWSVTVDWLFDHRILGGLGRTLELTAISLVCGIVIGMLVALMRMSANPVASGVAWLFVWIFRGTPELLQLLVWFNLAMVFPTIHIPGLVHTQMIHVMTPLVAAAIGLSINTGAYMSENIRGSILSVDSGQREAAAALGLGRWTTNRKVVLPQAMPSLLPAIGNHAIGLLKFTSLASTISYTELLGQAQQIYFNNAHIMELLFTVAIWYLVATTATSILQYYIERWYGRSDSSRRQSGLDKAISRGLRRLHTRKATVA